jgi:hypothetical protein
MLFGPSQKVITSGHDSNFCISFFMCWVEAAMSVSRSKPEMGELDKKML